MWQEKWASLLRGEIEDLLLTLPESPGLSDLLREPLVKRKRGLNTECGQDPPWPLLPLIVCAGISGACERALPVAAALQFILAAGDVFDDVEDGDAPDSLCAKCGVAIATSVASTLLMLGERSLTKLKFRGMDAATIVQIMDEVNSCYITACCGQYLDLTLGEKFDISEQDYLSILAAKSASQVKCACHLGALAGGANFELNAAFEIFGFNLGMACQIGNDILGITSGKDIVNPKITLPFIYTLTQGSQVVYSDLVKFISKPSNTIINPEGIKALLFREGAIEYSTIKMEYYRQAAETSLTKIREFTVDTTRLGLFLK